MQSRIRQSGYFRWLLVLPMLWATVCYAETHEFTYQRATENTDGSPLAPSDIRETRLYCNNVEVASEPGADGAIVADLPAGVNNCYGTHVHINGIESILSNMVVRVVEGAPPADPKQPNPPVLDDAPPPPPPPPTGGPSSGIVTFGDSMTDRNEFGRWTRYLASDLGLPLANYAKNGHRTDQILGQVQSFIAATDFDPNLDLFVHFLPNDADAEDQNSQCFDTSGQALVACITDAIEQNLGDAFAALAAAGYSPENVHVLPIPDGNLICTTKAVEAEQENPGAILFATNAWNGALGRAAAAAGYSIYDLNAEVLRPRYAAIGCAMWRSPHPLNDGKHYTNATSRVISGDLQTEFF